MKFILDKTYISDERLDHDILIDVVNKEHDLLEQKIDGELLYYEFNVSAETGEIVSIEYAIDNFANQTFIKGFELQNILKPHIKGVSNE